MNHDYDTLISQRAEHVFDVMAQRVPAEDVDRIRRAYELAREAHAPQRRKSGEPYILHPIAVATIVAEELQLDANSVIAAFLHDVVEDTPHTIGEVREMFGDDVAFLVGAVTKQKKDHYDSSLQVDNFRQILATVQHDVRALLVKLADRLHNMRTLSSMRPDKQMKIAGETDYFYAPLANRLGLYKVKTELENLSLRFRCPQEYEEMCSLIARDEDDQAERLGRFAQQLRDTLAEAGIEADVYVEYRKPYSLWRKMRKFGDDFNHLKYRHFTEVVYDTPQGMTEKDIALKIYSVLTNRFKEKPGGISNYIDTPKENGYQSFHLKLLPDFGRWQEVHLSSRRMILDSQLGCVAKNSDNIERWLEKFRESLREIESEENAGSNYLERVATSFYNDDIMTFTTKGEPVVLPQRSTVLDFAFEVDPEIGEHAKYARVNGFLTSIKAPLRRGDVVEVFADPQITPKADWLDSVVTYKAKRDIHAWLAARPKPEYMRCPHCLPIPGEEVVGFRDPSGEIILHKRDCPTAIRQASKHGESILSVDFRPDMTLYPVTILVRAVDRYHLLIDLVDCITNSLQLSIAQISTDTVDNIVECRISFAVHSAEEFHDIFSHISRIDGVDEVKRV